MKLDLAGPILGEISLRPRSIQMNEIRMRMGEPSGSPRAPRFSGICLTKPAVLTVVGRQGYRTYFQIQKERERKQESPNLCFIPQSACRVRLKPGTQYLGHYLLPLRMQTSTKPEIGASQDSDSGALNFKADHLPYQDNYMSLTCASVQVGHYQSRWEMIKKSAE